MIFLGKFLKKGVPDVVAAARSVLNDWNTGKIKYCTQPPEVQDNKSAHISASIVHSEAREFDVDNFETMETDILNHCPEKSDDVMEITSTGPLELRVPREEPTVSPAVIADKEAPAKGRKRKLDEEKKEKADPVLLLEGKQLSYHFCSCLSMIFLYIIRKSIAKQEHKRAAEKEEKTERS